MNSFDQNFVEQFLVSFLERAGAVVEKPRFALVDVLLPEELADYFQKEELQLAFDYEIARENPESTYVTLGSHLLDEVVPLARKYGQYTEQFWPGQEVVIPKNLDKTISQVVTYQHCRLPRVTGIWGAENVYYAFYFLAAFRFYEKEEEIFPAVVNGCTGLPCPGFEERWQELMPLEQAEYVLTRAPLLPLEQHYHTACGEVKPWIQKKSRLLRESINRLVKREQEKTNNYYREIISEIETRLKKASDEAKLERLQKQIEATNSEWKIRNEDIATRYEIEAEVHLDHLVACFIPALFIQIEVQHKRSFYQHCLIYNYLFRDIETPQCYICGKATRTLYPGNNGVLSCSDCRG